MPDIGLIKPELLGLRTTRLEWPREEGSPLGDPLRRLASERLKFPELSSLYIVLLNCDFSRFTFGGFSQAWSFWVGNPFWFFSLSFDFKVYVYHLIDKKVLFYLSWLERLIILLKYGTKLPIPYFQGIAHGEQKILRKSAFPRGFSTFLSTFHPSLKLGVKNWQKSFETPLENRFFLKIFSSPL